MAGIIGTRSSAYEGELEARENMRRLCHKKNNRRQKGMKTWVIVPSTCKPVALGRGGKSDGEGASAGGPGGRQELEEKRSRLRLKKSFSDFCIRYPREMKTWGVGKEE